MRQALESISMSLDVRTLEVVEWPSVQHQLAVGCRTPLGKELSLHWGPGALDREDAEFQSRAVLELVEFHKSSELRLPLHDVEDVRTILGRIERSGSITEEEFASIVRVHKCVQGLSRFIGRYPQLKHTSKLLFELNDLEEWAEEQFKLLDNHGKIVDDASEDLFALRKLTRDLDEQIQDRLNNFLHNPRMAELMQDFYVTVRQGRYVIPVKTNFKGRVPGIIHDLSKTEQTLFVEPEDVVELNNKLKVAQKEIEIEIERILATVVAKTQPYTNDFHKNLKLLARADLIDSAAQFFSQLKGDLTCARWTGRNFNFVKLRHPLLALRESVVPNSLGWENGFILTGPNTGGKTVLLKSIGLSFCLSKAGFPVLAQDVMFPSNLEDLFVDIGDEQDLGQDLSTFSAHLKILEKFLERSTEKSLVLIDEIATATAPEEGECLAQAYLEEMLQRNISFFVTTHYGRLKNFAMSEERCRIAAMAMDSKSRRPTYDLVLDVPGESSALDTAEAYGLPKVIVQRARQLRGDPSQETNMAVERLLQAKESFQERERQLEDKIRELEAKSVELARTQAEYQKKIKTAVEEESRAFLKDLSEQKKQLTEAIRNLRKEELQSEGPKFFQKIADLGQEIRAQSGYLEEENTVENFLGVVDWNQLKVGDFVDVSGLGLGRIVEIPDLQKLTKNTLVLVQVGEIKTRVSFGRLKSAAKGQIDHYNIQKNLKEAANVRKQRSQLADTFHKDSPVVGSTVCDVRGKTVDEAMAKIEIVLASLSRGDVASVTIIHGHGGEKLKNEIRNYLLKTRDDLSFRPGTWPGEGGDGVTVVEQSS